jgi:putative YphP/YqiW family bacilliredoxin
MRYDPAVVQPMRDELVRIGATELLTPESVDEALSRPGTVLVVVNSVCGCAAANARPAVAIASGHDAQPDRIVTVFAGQEIEATERARSHMPGYRPSSPSLALFRDGEQVFMLERHQIEGRDAGAIASDLRAAYDQFCAVTG